MNQTRYSYIQFLGKPLDKPWTSIQELFKKWEYDQSNFYKGSWSSWQVDQYIHQRELHKSCIKESNV